MKQLLQRSWAAIKEIDSYKKVLPTLTAILTQQSRYLPNIEWSDKSWTHNVFRAYELIFWRRYGIRPELSSCAYFDSKSQRTIATYQCHSFESILALIEMYIREMVKKHFFVPVKIWIPQLVTPTGLPLPTSPYLFAIAFNAVSQGSFNGTSLTVSHTCTGSERFLFSGIHSNTGTDFDITATYNSVSLTRQSKFQGSAANGFLYFFFLVNPSSGANNAVFTPNASANMNSNVNTSYTGVGQSGQPDASNTVTSEVASAGTQTLTITTIANNCWIAAFAYGHGDPPNASTGFTSRALETNGRGGDSNGPLSPGANSLSVTNSGAGAISVSMMGVSFSPPALPFRTKVIIM